MGETLPDLLPHEGLLSKFEDIKPTLNWMLYNFNALRKIVRDYNEEGNTPRDFGPSGYKNTERHITHIEDQIIHIIACANIVECVEFALGRLTPPEVYLYELKFKQEKPYNNLIEIFGVSKITIIRRIDKLYLKIVEEMERREITYQEIYWMHQKFEFVKRLKKIMG